MKKTLLFFCVISLILSALDIDQSFAQAKNPFLEIIKCPKEILNENAEISVMIYLPKDHAYNEEMPFQFEILKEGKVLRSGILKDPQKELPLSVHLDSEYKGPSTLEIKLEVPYCSTALPKLCKFKSIKFIQPFSTQASGKPLLQLETQI